MQLTRPNGLIERLPRGPRWQIELNGYGRAQPGPATALAFRSPPTRIAAGSHGADPTRCAGV
jgi:hypothetical protein